MALKNLNTLALDSEKKYKDTFRNMDIKLHEEFKIQYAQVLRNENSSTSIRFLDYSAEVITSSKNIIFVPSQWFCIATFMVDLYIELRNYKESFINILTNIGLKNKMKDIVKSLRDKEQNDINNKVKSSIQQYFKNNKDDVEFMWEFLTNYDWWHGQKTIDRQDFYASPILSLLGLVNVSQGYVADIVSILASDMNLKREAELLTNQLEESSPSNYKELLPQKNTNANQIDISRNLILYGPPGTGKTFKTVELALKICGYWTDDMRSNRKKAIETFKKLQDIERIEFVTFHQSMSYEEFIEGLSAQVDDNGEVFYSVRDGIFKKISKRASQDLFNEGDIIGGYRIVHVGKELISVLNSKDAICPIPLNLVEDIAKNVLEGKSTLDNIRQGKYKEETSKLYDNYILGYKSILYSLVKHYIENIDKVSEDKNYVIIIDEINRANISKVFGDLITLIDTDKRKGRENEMNVRLPYSQDHFIVPNNLFIIGTMNTADRSIALMDIALRRRFEFKEIMPQANILGSISLEEDEIDLSKLLEVINKRITVLLDRNHSIGQTIFLGINNVKQLVSAIKAKLLPLLQEYFYEDWEKISLVLGDNQKKDPTNRFIIKDIDYNLASLFGNTDYINEDDIVYTINPRFGSNDKQDFELIKSIYTQES